MAKNHVIRAIYVSKTLPLQKLKTFLKHKLLQSDRKKLLFRTQKDGYLFIYSFGILVFYDADNKFIKQTIMDLQRAGIEIIPERMMAKYEESYSLVKSKEDSVGFEHVRLKKITLESLSVLAWIIARSVALDNYEAQVERMMEEFSKLNNQLKKKGKLKIGGKKLMKLIAANNSIIEAMISKLSLLEEPEVTWEKEKLDWLFNKMYEMFEIKERFKVVEYKLNFLQGTTNTLLEAKRNRYEFWLEMTIIILIFIEVVLWLAEIWWL